MFCRVLLLSYRDLAKFRTTFSSQLFEVNCSQPLGKGSNDDLGLYSVNTSPKAIAVNDSGTGIWYNNVIFISVVVICLGCIIIYLTIYYQQSRSVGWIAVVGASITFGATGVPMKMKDISKREIDPLLFSIFTSFGIFVVNFPLMIYLGAHQTFQFKPISIIGSLDIFLITLFAFQAVKKLGYSKAPAIWCGIGMFTAFLWGSIVFHERIANLGFAVVSLIFLIGGVYLVCTSQTKVEEEVIRLNSFHESVQIDGIEAEETSSLLREFNIHEAQNYIISIVSNESYYLSLIGYFYCLLAGILDGSLMVPFKLVDANNLTEMYNYLASFGLSSLVLAPILYLLYIVIFHGGVMSFRDFKLAFLPGLCSGILWACGNFLSVHATYYLGIRVGFPLTQTCVIFTSFWGVFYFQEMSITANYQILIKYSLGIVSVVLGSYFLANSK